MKIEKIVLLTFMFFSFFISCQDKKSKNIPKVDKKEIKEIQKTLNVGIHRYERALFTMDMNQMTNELLKIKKEFLFFVREDPTTSEYKERLVSFINNNVNQDLYKEVEKQFPDLSQMEKDFSSAFTLIKYHFPEATPPHIYTAILGLYYEMPIIYEDTVLVIALDMYLGSDCKCYKKLGSTVPRFVIRRFSKEYILRDCMKEMAYDYIEFNRDATTLLDEMILEGKRWVFAEITLPTTHDTIISGYSLEKLQWAQQNELNVWTYLIDKEYLYSNDNALIRKLTQDAPFTAYFGNVSPGQIGAWIGWQICRSWIQHNPDKKVSDLMKEKDSRKILKDSRYKPQKRK